MGGVVSREELAALTRRALQARAALKASSRTRLPTNRPLRFLSRYRTSDRLGAKPYERGDPAALLVWRDLMLRGQITVRTYRAIAELRVRVVLDPRPTLLAHPQTGPFAVKLAYCLALSAVGVRHPARVAFLGLRPATAEVSRPRGLGVLLDDLAGVGPVEAPGADPVAGMVASLTGSRANVNLFAVLHVGYPTAVLDRMLRVMRERVERAVAFLLIAADELAALERDAVDPETGRVTVLPDDPAAHLAAYVENAVATGARLGVRVEPLVIEDHRADIDALFPFLAGLA